MSVAPPPVAPPPRPFFGPLFGMALLFALVGPLIGGAIFLPLAFVLEAPAQVDAVHEIGWIAALIGHTIILAFAYVVGLAPAAATGALFAAYDYFAPPRTPRALMAAVIGALLAQAVFTRIAGLGSWAEGQVRIEIAGAAGDWFSGLIADGFDEALQHAFVASGAVAAFVCALAANLIGLTGRREIANTSQPT